jgi:hypothetical protein
MVGGGKDAFIGGVHRIASRLDGEFELVAGALSSTPEKSKRPRKRRGARLAPDRIYDDFTEMAIREAGSRTASRRCRSSRRTTCTTRPREFLKRGIHVICDKPLTSTLATRRSSPRLAHRKRRAVRPDAQLHRLPDGPAGPRDGRERRDRRHPRGAGRIRAGLAVGSGRDHRHQQAGRMAHRPGALRRGRLDRRHRHPCLQPRGLRHRPELEALAAISTASSRAAGSTTTAMSCCATRAAPRACCGAARSRRATRTRCAARLRRQGRARMGAGRSELPVVHAVRRAQAPAHPRGRRRARVGGAGQPHPGGHPEGYLEGFANIYAEAAGRSGRSRRASVDSSKRGGNWVSFGNYVKT